MEEPVALERARALRRHVDYLHAPVAQFCVTLTRDEGFELLEWFLSDAKERPAAINAELLAKDIAAAKRHRDPFRVLREFTLFGLTILHRTDIH